MLRALSLLSLAGCVEGTISSLGPRFDGPMAIHIQELRRAGWRLSRCGVLDDAPPGARPDFPGRPPFTICWEDRAEQDATVAVWIDADRVVQRFEQGWRGPERLAAAVFEARLAALVGRFGPARRCAEGYRAEWDVVGTPSYLLILAGANGTPGLTNASFRLTGAHENPVCPPADAP